MKKKTGIHELYAHDPLAADRLLWGRESDPVSRRGFLRGSGLAAMGAVLGSAIPFADNLPGGLIPAALAQTDEPFSLPGKDGLTVLNDRPINAETPAHLLDVRRTAAAVVRADVHRREFAVEQARHSARDRVRVPEDRIAVPLPDVVKAGAQLVVVRRPIQRDAALELIG